MPTRPSLFCLLLVAAGCAEAPTDTGFVDDDGADYTTIIVPDGESADVPVMAGQPWLVQACGDGVCADVSDRVIVVDDYLCGPVERQGWDYAREMPVPEVCPLLADGYALHVTVWAAG